MREGAGQFPPFPGAVSGAINGYWVLAVSLSIGCPKKRLYPKGCPKKRLYPRVLMGESVKALCLEKPGVPLEPGNLPPILASVGKGRAGHCTGAIRRSEEISFN